jgi:sugar lactone lactonase YvrE
MAWSLRPGGSGDGTGRPTGWQAGSVHITLDSAVDVVTDIRFPEGNRWHDGRLWYSDMHTGEVFSIDPGADAAPRLETTVAGQSSGLGWLADGRLVVSSMESRTVVAVDQDGGSEVFADLSAVESSLLNDLVVDEVTGRTYIGAFGYDLYGGEELRPGPLYVIDQDGSFRLAAAWSSRTARTSCPGRGPWWSARPGVAA